jgi:hypothetical protein
LILSLHESPALHSDRFLENNRDGDNDDDDGDDNKDDPLPKTDLDHGEFVGVTNKLGFGADYRVGRKW